METETATVDTLYTETTGTTCYVAGQRGTVTGLQRDLGRIVGAFVKLDGPTDTEGRYTGAGALLLVELGHATGDRGAWHTVTGSRPIDRAEFDRLTGLDSLAHDLGWR